MSPRAAVFQQLKAPRQSVRSNRFGNILRRQRSLPSLPKAVSIDAQIREGATAVAALQLVRTTRGVPANSVLALSATAEALNGVRPRPVRNWVSDASKMLSWVQILSTPTADTPGTCLLLHFDARRYLFGNMSEGTQRALTQRKAGIVKMEHVFLSGLVTWANTGGMLGLILTLADALQGSRRAIEACNQARKEKGRTVIDTPAQSLHIHGGPNLTYTLATARHFVFRKGMPIKPHEITEDPRLAEPESTEPDWQDDCIKVWNVPLYQSNISPATTPRKRDHDEMSKDENAEALSKTAGATLVTAAEQEKLDRAAVDAVVEHMFNSSWRLDALIDTTLHQVELPATIFVRDSQGKIVRYDGPLPSEKPDVEDIPVLVRTPWPAATVETIPPTKPSRQSVCYIVKTQALRGKFNPRRATELGVQKHDFKTLIAGENVIGKDGMTVTPDMVLGEQNAGHGFVVADVPDASYVDSFVNRPEWTNNEIMVNVVAFYWILGPGVVDEPRIRDFMATHNSYKHFVSSLDTGPNMLALESPALLSTKLHRIDPERFPLLQYNNTARDLQASIPSSEVGRVGKQVHLTPRLVYSDEAIVQFPNTALGAKHMSKESLELAEIARRKIADPEFLANIERDEADIPGRDTEVIPLGTGSAMPSKYRNVSATLVRVPDTGNYLFDCGENTLGQMHRAFGSQETDKIISNLKGIFISHLHADHHLGTTSVLKAWHEATKSDPAAHITVASTQYMRKWLREYSYVEEFGYSRIHFLEGNGSWTPDAASGLSRIETCLVDHCHGALAGALTWPSGLKIAYSGDCRPSDDFVEIGRDATLLIHESTFDDDKKGDAVAKKHSTIGEALDVGRRMRARRVLLTHFSQRYAKVSLKRGRITAEGEDLVKDQAVLMAFDQMRVKIGDFRKAEAFLPAIKKLVEGEDGDS